MRADAEFGPATRRAVKRFERTVQLNRNGQLETTEAPTLRDAAAEAAARRRTAETQPPAPAQAEEDPFSAAGGAAPVAPTTTAAPVAEAPGENAVLNADGTASAPASAPPEVKAIIAAGNEIAKKPYKYGGGHGRWNDSGYDCSGSMSYAFHGAGMLGSALDSTGFISWGKPGKGEWVTTYANAGHSYMVVAGLRFDTSGLDADGSRWHTSKRSAAGYTVRHPNGL